MNTYKKVSATILNVMILLVITINLTQAQEFNLVKGESTLTVLGTSSLHDWHVTAENQSGKITFKNLETGQIEKLAIEIVSESLKSGKTAMDKNTYKALNTDKYKTISFQLIEIKEISNKGAGKFLVNTQGDLTISGVKKRVPLEFSITIVGNKITLVGQKQIKMTDFNITPPKALLGTITTGNDITIKFSSIFK